jgi:hypothetical protein
VGERSSVGALFQTQVHGDAVNRDRHDDSAFWQTRARCLGEASTYGESSIINRFNTVMHDMPSLDASGVLLRTIQFVEVMGSRKIHLSVAH